MKQKFFQEIEIPETVEVELKEEQVKIKGKEGENIREFKLGKLNIEKKDNKIIIEYEKATKKEKKIINTSSAHIKNMIKGVQEKFKYELKICSSHFPMNVEKKEEKIIIKNFLGEKTPRESIILPNVEIQIEKEIITVESIDKEAAGQTAANLEQATKIKGRDIRIFQDGIYITNKCGKNM